MKNNFVDSDTSTSNLFFSYFLIFFYLWGLYWSRWVTIPRHLGKPWIYIIDKNSKVYISKPKELSINVRTISADLAKSDIYVISSGHSINVTLYFYDTLIVIGPFGSMFLYV